MKVRFCITTKKEYYVMLKIVATANKTTVSALINSLLKQLYDELPEDMRKLIEEVIENEYKWN